MFVSHERRLVEALRRSGAGWMRTAAGPGESIRLESVPCTLEVDRLYDRAGA